MSVATADGTDARAKVDGEGPAILIIHPGMSCVKDYDKVSNLLKHRFQVVRIFRRQYRSDLKSNVRVGSPCTVADEVSHVLAIAETLEKAVLIYGHSSGGVVALETLVASQSLFVSGMIYEPASVIKDSDGLFLAGERIPHNGGVGEGLARMRQALESGKPGKALSIFTQYIAGMPGLLADFAGGVAALFTEYRDRIPFQIDDLEAMERLGLRLDAYANLSLPIAMVCGERSSKYLKDIDAAVANALPMAERVTLVKQAHSSHSRDPAQLAKVIEDFADKAFS